MEPTQADLQKAANMFAHVAKMKKAHDDFNTAQSTFHDGMEKLLSGAAAHHAKMAKLHKARHAEATDHFSSLNKILGAEEGGGKAAEEPKPISITSAGTESAIKLDKPDLENMLAKFTDNVVEKVKAMIPSEDSMVKTVLTALMGGPNGAKEAVTAANENPVPAAGIGDRSSNVQPIKKGLRLGIIPKAADTAAGPVAAEPPAVEASPEKTAEIMKKINNGDALAALEFMKGAQMTHEVPATLSEQFKTLSGGR